MSFETLWFFFFFNIPFAFYRLLSESPRWLISKGRVNEAQNVIRKIARINKKDIPDEFFDSIELKQPHVRIGVH